MLCVCYFIFNIKFRELNNRQDTVRGPPGFIPETPVFVGRYGIYLPQDVNTEHQTLYTHHQAL